MAPSTLFLADSEPGMSGSFVLFGISLLALAAFTTVLPAQAAARQQPHPTRSDTSMRDTTMRMPMNDMPSAMGGEPLGLSMQRMASGTSWQPDATPMFASHSTLGTWELMLHGVAFLQYDDQRSTRGDRQFGSVNWGMVMASRDLAAGRLSLRAMMSAEPFTVGGRGYPLLLQSGEAYHGQALHDRQHPHDLFMELAALYNHAIDDNLAWSLYVAPVGEPAIGPVAFPHRSSAAGNPLAPIGHHWQDATHVSFGVITAGVYTRTVKLEGSIFNGREPDDVRTNFDYKGRSLDSYAGRLTVNPNANWSLSSSYAYLKSPEQLSRESLRRVVAAVLRDRSFGPSGDWASSVIYGGNKHAGESRLSNSVLAETNLQIDDQHTVFGRAEFAQKSAEDLALSNGAGVPALTDIGGLTTAGTPASHSIEFNVGELTFGYIRELTRVYGGSLGLGFAGTVNRVPHDLQQAYGTRTPVGAVIFLRVRPGRMRMNTHAAHKAVMHGMKDTYEVRQ